MLPLIRLCLASLAVAAAPRPATAGGADLQSACANEIGMLCSDVKYDAAALRACLLEQEDSLLAGCRKALLPKSAPKRKSAPAPEREEIVFLEGGSDAQNARLFHARAKNGDAEAQHSLAAMCQQGRGVKQNDAEAVRWFIKAARGGHSGAQYNLGFIYETGKGVAVDNAEAYLWYYAYAGSNAASRAGPFPTYSQFDPPIIKKLKKLEALLSPAEVSSARERAEAISAQAR